MFADTLKIFVAVVEEKHFSRAAEKLHLSQPAVSLQIRNLENALGVKLLHRSPKTVQLTKSGEILYAYARKMLAHYEEAKREIHELHSVVTGKLRIGASFTIGEYILPKVLADYARQYPGVDIEVIISNTEEVIFGLQSSGLEIGLIEGHPPPHQEIKIEPFMDDEMVLVVPRRHPLAQARQVKEDMLHDQVWVTRETGSGTRTYSDQLIRDLGLRVKRSYIFSSIQGVKEAVIAGLGIALLSRWTVQKELASGELYTFQIEDKQIIRPFSFAKRKQTDTSKAVNVFLEKIEAFAKLQ